MTMAAKLWIVLLVLATIDPRPCPAQSTFGSIGGLVTDATGAVVPGVSVVVTNTSTNIAKTALSGEAGTYDITHLLPGTYRLRAELPGFKTFVRDGVAVESRASVRIDVRMEVGEQSAEVNVTAPAPVIETETAQIADRRDAKELDWLPTVMGVNDWTAYVLTLPGVQSVTTFTFAFNGARSAQAEFLFDGILSPRGGTPLSGTQSTLEMISELKLHTANNSAEFGSPGVMSAVTKSGTNKVHGSVYYFHNNSALNARDFFAATAPVFKDHSVGVTVGGPVYVPKLYDGHDRTFFMLSYFGQRTPGKGSANATVPTAAMRLGDFSQVVDSRGVMIPIRDPLTGAAFSGNVIPAGRLDAVSLRVQERFYPTPNFGPPDLLFLNNRVLFDRKQLENRWDARIDQKITDRNMFYVRVGYRAFPSQPLTNSLITIGTQDQYRRNTTLAISDTHTFTPGTVNEFRFGMQRSNNRVLGPLLGMEVLRYTGIQGLSPTGAEELRGMPQFGISGFNTIGSAGTRPLVEQVFHGSDSVTLVRGRHSIKAGVDLVRSHVNSFSTPDQFFGAFSFTNFFSGHAYADFLLGLPKTAARATLRGPMYRRGSDLYLFVQDDWKASSRLTLNWGIRYEYQFASVDKDGKMYNLEPRTAALVVPDEAALASVNPLLPPDIQVVTAAQVGFPQTLRDVDQNNVVPRLGLAFRPSTNTVLRAGYGVFMDNFGTDVIGGTGSPLFGFTETFENFEANRPSFVFPNPFGTVGSIGTISASGFKVNLKNPHIQQWSLTLEREISNIGLRASYVGTRGTNLGYRRDLNVPLPSTVAFNNARRPFPQYRGLTFADNGGNSIYHGLQLEAERRFMRGLQFQAAWTYSNQIGDIDDDGSDLGPTIENPFNRSRERGREAYGVRHRVNGSLMYELPFGHGRSYLSGSPSWVHHLAGGWAIAGLLYFESGRFFTPSFTGRDISGTGISGGRPDRVADGNLPSGEQNIDRWFDISAFVMPAANSGRFGNAGRNILEGPGLNVQHLNVIKSIYARESLDIEFQLNIRNVFNHPNFALPSGNLSAPGSVGRVTATRGLIERAGARAMTGELRINF
jgi:hypothetical protein